MMDSRQPPVALNFVPGVGSLQLTRLLAAFGDVERAARASAQEIQHAAGIQAATAGRIAAAFRDAGAVETELALAQRAGARVATIQDPEYPDVLRSIPDLPLVLYVRGSILEVDQLAVAVVGARHASHYGLQTAERLQYAISHLRLPLQLQLSLK